MKNSKTLFFAIGIFFAFGFSSTDEQASDLKNTANTAAFEYCYQVRGECGTSTVGTACGYIINGQCVPF